MKIQRVLIDGYKNLSNVNISLDKITALVALNNFGKSNVLSGINYGLEYIKGSEEKKIAMMSDSNLIPINKTAVGKNYKFEMEVSTDVNKNEYRVVYGYEFEWGRNDEDEPKIINEYLKLKIDEKGQKYNQIINRTVDGAYYKSSPTGRCSTKAIIETNELVVNKLKAFDDLYYNEIIRKINNIRIYMEDNLDAKSFYRPNPLIRKGFGDLMIDTDNLPRIIYKLKKSNEDKYQLLLDIYKVLFPNIEDILVQEFQVNKNGEVEMPEDIPFIISNSVYALFVKDKNLSQAIDFETMSDGAKRVFMILTKIIMAKMSKVSLIVIEEPENSVHPGLFREYIEAISQLLDDCKVIITSHSPYIIDYLEISNIHVGLSRNNGIAEFFSFKRTAQKTLKTDADSVRMNVGDYIFSMLTDNESNIMNYLECDTIG